MPSIEGFKRIAGDLSTGQFVVTCAVFLVGLVWAAVQRLPWPFLALLAIAAVLALVGAAMHEGAPKTLKPDPSPAPPMTGGAGGSGPGGGGGGGVACGLGSYAAGGQGGAGFIIGDTEYGRGGDGGGAGDDGPEPGAQGGPGFIRITVLGPNGQAQVTEFTIDPTTGQQVKSVTDYPEDPAKFNVTSYNQQGGVTAGQYINQDVPASLSATIGNRDVPTEGGSFQTTFHLTIENVHRVQSLSVGANSPTARAVNLVPARVGAAMMSVSDGTLADGSPFMSTGTPTRYMICTVTTERPGEDIKLLVNLDQ